MRKTIVRTITATTIESANVTFANGKPVVTPNEPIIMSGVVGEEKALKEVRKVYGNTANVTEVKAVNDVYEISVEDFIKNAKKVVAPTKEQVEEGAAE